MSNLIIIIVCVLLLIAYSLDLSSSRTKIPTAIVLLFIGWVCRQIAGVLNFRIPDLSDLLPILGTVGLILIVLEGSLELELQKTKTRLIGRSFFSAVIPIMAIGFALAYSLHYFTAAPFKNCVLNAIPLCIISSAIAIPSTRILQTPEKEFVIYESSFSDIIGVLLFNFVAVNDSIDISSFGYFALEILLMLVISFLAAIGLAYLLHRINHHIKFVPIIILIILIYAIAKTYHLPALIFILIFGLFINNLEHIRRFKWLNRMHPEELDREVDKFREIVAEGTFIIRAFFFLLFGYLIETTDLFATDTLIWSLSIVTAIFLVRWLTLRMLKVKILPLVYIAPRGLITILLFLSVAPLQAVSEVNRSLILQVIIITGLIMTSGLILNRSHHLSDHLPPTPV